MASRETRGDSPRAFDATRHERRDDGRPDLQWRVHEFDYRSGWLPPDEPE